MASTANPDIPAIEGAYQDQVRALFKALVTNLTDQPVTHQTDQQSVAKFSAGMKIAKHARDLALNALGAAPLAIKTAERKKTSKAAR
jgi:hypothetical protein